MAQNNNNKKCPLEQAKSRLLLVAVTIVLAFTAVTAKLVDATLFSDAAFYNQKVAAASYRPKRADIVDRQGKILATNLITYSLYANPKRVIDPLEATEKLIQTLPGLSQKKIYKQLSGDKQFVWIKRNLTPKQKYAANALGIPGLSFKREERRVYPAGRIAAHILGYTDVDTNGIAGIEQGMNSRLVENPSPLYLSIDLGLQHILNNRLSLAMEKYSAVGAAGLIMDANNGEVLAMASLPDYDPNNVKGATTDERFNKVTLGVYEMGSTLKVVNHALALETGSVQMTDTLDARYPIKVGRYRINDYLGKKRLLSVPEVLIYSSNIGSAKMALRAGKERQQAFLQQMGLLTAPHLEIPEIGAPLIPTPWRESDTMTISFGHSLSINALQLANAMAAIVNGGNLRKATLLKNGNKNSAMYQVVSRKTSEQMRRLLRMNAEIGSAKKANVPGYLVGGKTGTAEKRTDGRYDKNKRRSSLLAAFPMHNPQYVVWVMLDEPKGIKETYGFATAGWVAAPLAGEIIAAIAPLMNILPLDEEEPAIKKILALDVDGSIPGEEPIDALLSQTTNEYKD